MNSNEDLKEKLKRMPLIVIRDKKRAAEKKIIIENFKKLLKDLKIEKPK